MMRNRWPRKLIDFAEHYLSLFDDTEIAWYAHLDGDPVITQAGVSTKGKKPVVDKPAVRSMRSREKSGLEHGGWTPESIVNTLLQ
jgi:hypothetical protein